MQHRDNKSRPCLHPSARIWAIDRALAAQLVIVLCGLMLLQGSAHAQQSDGAPKTMVEVFRVMLSEDGIMTPKLHKVLWDDLVRQIGNDPAEIKRFWSIIEKNPDFSSARFNYEAGRSAIKSLKGNKVMTTPGYEAAGKTLVAAMKKETDKEKIRGSMNTWNDSFAKLGGVRYDPKKPQARQRGRGI